MRAQYISRRWVYDINIPAEWDSFWFSLCLGMACLAASAFLANVRIGSFPANPLYWHIWVVINAKASPSFNDERPRIYRPYMFFWAGSICFFFWSALVLIAIFFGAQHA